MGVESCSKGMYACGGKGMGGCGCGAMLATGGKEWGKRRVFHTVEEGSRKSMQLMQIREWCMYGFESL